MSIKLKDTIYDLINNSDKLDGKDSSEFSLAHDHTSYAKTIKIGNTSYNASNSIISLPSYPTIPTTLPNPQSLSIILNGVTTIYDGSSTKSLIIDTSQGNYLPISGGQIEGTTTEPLFINNSGSNSNCVGISFKQDNTKVGHIGYYSKTGIRLHEESSLNGISVKDGIPYYYLNSGTTLYKLWHENNDGSGSGLDADTLDGNHATQFFGKGWWNEYNHNKSISTLEAVNSSTNAWNSEANVTLKLVSSNNAIVLSAGGSSNERVGLIQVGHASTGYAQHTGSLYLNKLGGKVYIGTTEAATVDSNVASATKLQTARTIWGQSFNGTGNVDGKLTINHNTTDSENPGFVLNRNTSGDTIKIYNTSTSKCYIRGSIGFPNLENNPGMGWHVFPENSQWTNSLGNTGSSYNISTGSVTFGSWNDNAMPLYIDITNKKVGIKTVSPTSALQVVGSIRSSETQFTNLGSGTYDVSSLSNHQTYGLQIEGPLKSDSSSADKYPITFSWRGGFSNLGGIQFVCENSGNHINIKKDKTSLKLYAWNDATYIESGNSDFTANMPLKITGISGGNGSDLYLNFNNVRANGVVRASSGYVALGSHGTLLSLGAYSRTRVITTGWTASESDFTTIYIPGSSNSNDAYLKIRQWDLIYNGNTVIHSGNISNYVTASSGSSYLSPTGFGSGTLTWNQTNESFYGSNWTNGWASYLINNHGNGATYYNWVMAFPFWSYPYYKRMTGSTSSTAGWYYFVTQENIGSMSVNYANSSGNANTVDGYHISVGSSSGSDASVIYFVI